MSAQGQTKGGLRPIPCLMQRMLRRESEDRASNNNPFPKHSVSFQHLAICSFWWKSRCLLCRIALNSCFFLEFVPVTFCTNLNFWLQGCPLAMSSVVELSGMLLVDDTESLICLFHLIAQELLRIRGTQVSQVPGQYMSPFHRVVTLMEKVLGNSVMPIDTLMVPFQGSHLTILLLKLLMCCVEVQVSSWVILSHGF